MSFNSIEFAIYLPIVFLLYWFVANKNHKLQNLLLVVASYIFYGWWDWRFLFLIFISSLVDYLVGIGLSKTEISTKRKMLLFASILVNIGFLGFFKYYNFFAESFAQAFSFLGMHIESSRLNIILPVGISFYTFQTLSYSIDVYKKKLEPTKDIIVFFAFVSFFPQLVAGPIERATNLLVQFYKKRQFEYDKAVDGMRQILWGLFKKIVIADNCAGYVNEIFANYSDHTGSTLLLGAVLFAFQIYGDFSGYSDIAIGTARLFGFNIMRNFAFPYFSRDIAEFWRRWHISLSTWFRDYIYIPLGGSRGRTWVKVRNIFIIFLVSGFWHGANWTFIAWGFINACYYLPLMLLKQNRKNIDTIAVNRVLPGYKEFFQIGFTFFLTTIAWIFFRAQSIQEAFSYLNRMFSKSLLEFPDIDSKKMILLIIIFVIIEWLQRDKLHPLMLDPEIFRKPIRWSIYFTILLSIFFLGNFSSNYEFIYFQF
jgi:alginate O-acetyltransferase complex protein AlgI